jgi:hypothetical protein
VDEKIPSYKYKFKQIFKKIGQAKALDLFYFVAVLTWTVKVKNAVKTTLKQGHSKAYMKCSHPVISSEWSMEC